MSITNSNPKKFFVQTETLTLTSGFSSAVDSTAFSTKYGDDYSVFVNTDATALTSGCAAHILGSADNVNFATTKETLVTDCNGAISFALYDISANGELPYYKVRLKPADDMVGEEVKVQIVCGRKE